MPNTILLKGRGIRKEAVAGGTITPGDLLTINSSAQLIRHATAGGKAGALFAVENDIVGKEIDDNYSANDYVQAEYLTTGCEVYANVAAAAAAIVIGDLLESDGTGGLRKAAASLTAASGTSDGTVADVTNAFSQTVLNNNFQDVATAINAMHPGTIAQALEAVDNSGGGSRARIKVVLI